MMKWNFPIISPDRVESDPTQAEFFNNNDVDRNESLIREVCQNALDAGIDGEVTVKFSLNEQELSPDEMSSYIDSISPHLDAIRIENPLTNSPVSFLRIEDFGTKGLTGDLSSKDEGNFALFWRRYGKSEKGGVSGGRWGLGKTVYPNSSKANLFFGLTVRNDDKKTCLLGQAMLGSHEIDGHRHDPYGTYSISEPGQIQMPSESEQDISRFIETFALERREGEFGLSIVVPFPHDDLDPDKLKRAAILHYFFPIIEGKLKISVNGVMIDSHTIRNVSAEVGGLQDMDKIFDFAEKVGEKAEDPDIHIADDEIQNRVALTEADFTEADLAGMRAQYEAGAVVSVRVPLCITPKGKPASSTYIDLYVKHDPDLDKGQDYYIRNGIAISGNKMFGKKLAMGFLLAKDPAVCSFLGDAENPAHTQWTESRIGGKYEQPRITLRFIKRVLNELLGLLSKTPEKTDSKVFQNIFFIEKNEGASGPGPTPPVPPPKIESVTQPYKLSRSASGFTLKANPDCVRLPYKTEIQMAYAIRKGNPFKKYNVLDFKITDPEFKIVVRGATKGIAGDNKLTFLDPRPEFQLSIEGFDVHRDVEIDLKNYQGAGDDE